MCFQLSSLGAPYTNSVELLRTKGLEVKARGQKNKEFGNEWPEDEFK